MICHITPCSDSPCLNGGECSISTITDMAKSQCNCKNGFHGEICQYTPCTALQCGKYGNCLLDDESPEGFRIDFNEQFLRMIRPVYKFIGIILKS